MKNGLYMLPLKVDLRKKYNIKEGDTVEVCLFLDNSELLVPEEILECLEDFPQALDFFNKMTESNKKYYIDWVAEAKNMDTKVNRINKMIDRLLDGKRMYDNLVIGYWLLVIGYWLLVIGYWLLVIGYWRSSILK